ncbi:serine/arginine-rich splicing factor 3a isoform X2 [Chelmon rostratus]|uniref:serine/arginine-rich splicing factor 3a isoform X2 n=1 Tax=Chelmon rostratus TaxID=109905 RepID=UPI001BE802DF|nr:serine/arginine-rich splicing factor 3a isoform X2 [Chelmon rostratus]
MQFPASSSSSSNLNPIDSGPLHIINQSASLLSLFSTQLLCQREQPLAYIPTHPPPPKKAGKIYNYPFQQATNQLHISNICIMWQILSAIRPLSPSVWLPCAISILSKSPKIITEEEEPQSQPQQVSFKRQTQISVSFQRQES